MESPKDYSSISSSHVCLSGNIASNFFLVPLGMRILFKARQPENAVGSRKEDDALVNIFNFRIKMRFINDLLDNHPFQVGTMVTCGIVLFTT